MSRRSSSSLTRWQSFRRRQQQQQNQQGDTSVRTLAGWSLLLALYTYAFVAWEPARMNHHAVHAWNEALQEKARIEAVDRQAKRIRAREIWLQAYEARRNETARAAAATTNDHPVDANTLNQDKTAAEPSSRLLDLLIASYLIGWFLRIRRHQRETEVRRSLLPITSAVAATPANPSQRRMLRRQQQRAAAAGGGASEYERLLVQQFLQFQSTAAGTGRGGTTNSSARRVQGMAAHEIDRCPLRTIQNDDDLLLTARTVRNDDTTNSSSESSSSSLPTCAICLETYEPQQQVRTIPCFHTFHKECIDPWLRQRAECPICKHSALG